LGASEYLKLFGEIRQFFLVDVHLISKGSLIHQDFIFLLLPNAGTYGFSHIFSQLKSILGIVMKKICSDSIGKK